jgi:hypothetical protein
VILTRVFRRKHKSESNLAQGSNEFIKTCFKDESLKHSTLRVACLDSW